MTIEVGDTAPAFTRTAHNGESVRIGPGAERVTVLYFYPKDETAGCTAQACAFRDSFEAFANAGAIVVGVSDDSLESHRSFAEHRRLPFPLLADEKGELRKSFDVPNWLGILRNRVTFVIDRGGIVRHVFQSQLHATQHVEEALRIVRQLS
jgi:peroxiredoxin Q/BCP